jgi:glutamate racemase
MPKKLKSIFLLFLLSSFFYSLSGKTHLSTQEEKLEHFFRKKEVTIVVTDSGLGGLSIMAQAIERMREAKGFLKVNFVFFNALFSNEGGYNSLKTREEKIQIFDNALKSLEKNYHPDLILIGCNTLSALYEDTPFSQETILPVVGIIESGTDLISQNLKESLDSRVIIFATQTTTSEETHKKKLEEAGFSPERIIYQACPDLVPYIEKGYASDETEMLILAYVDEALQNAQDTKAPVYVSLNCTHYGYSLDLWKEAFQSLGVTPVSFLNPNSRMLDFLFQPKRLKRFPNAEVSVRVVSMVEVVQEKMDSIGKWLRQVSPQTAEALLSYDLRPNLFEWKKYVKSER